MLLMDATRGYMMDAQIERQSPGVIELKQQRLGRFLDWCEDNGVTSLEAVTPNLVRAFVLHLQEEALDKRRGQGDRKLAPSTIRGYVKVVRAFFAWCKREGLLGGHEDPPARLPRVKVPQYVISTFTPDQMSALLAACDQSEPEGFRDYTMLLVLMDTGIRASELCGLKLEDIHDGYLTVFGKGEKEREVGLGPTAGRALWKYVHQHRKAKSEHERHVFLSYRGKPFDAVALWYIIQRVGEAAGVEGVRLSPHTFRHTFAKAWLANGGDIFKLSRVLGHTEVQTTQIYLKDFQSRDARVEHSQFSPVEQLRLGRRNDVSRRSKSDRP